MAISQLLLSKKERSAQLAASSKQKELFKLHVASSIRSLLLTTDRFTLGAKVNLEPWGMANRAMLPPQPLWQTLKAL